jgi:hypothetical protein
MLHLLRKDFVEKIISPEFLDNAIIFFILLTALLVSLIYYFLYEKKKRHRLRDSVKKSFELWISKAILEEYDDEEKGLFHIPDKFIKHFKNPVKRQYALDELLNSKKNLTGSAGHNIVQLYEQLDFKKYSVKKFKSKLWYIKAQGIQELYVMDQADMLTRIYKNTNSANEYVRMEAQTGVIHFSGFEGLRFLEVLSYPMSEWQQIKLLEQLRSKNMIELGRLSGWLKSQNDSVVIFSLKLTEEFQQYHVHNDAVACLSHPDHKVRYQAIKALERIANEETPSVLTKNYRNETAQNKILILQALKSIGSDEEVPFFLQALDEQDDNLKLAAARSLVFVSGEGLNILQQRANLQPDPYAPILSHVKAETR